MIHSYAIAYGHNPIFAATAAAATTKSPRRIPLGINQFAAAAAVWAQWTRIYVPFDRPLPVNPWEYVAILAKNIGAVTTTGVITFFVGFDAGWVI